MLCLNALTIYSFWKCTLLTHRQISLLSLDDCDGNDDDDDDDDDHHDSDDDDDNYDNNEYM